MSMRPLLPLLRTGQVLKGRRSAYTIVTELERCTEGSAVYLARNQKNEKCIVKSIRGPPSILLRNAAENIKRYQAKTSFIRPLIDEIQEPTEPTSIVLRHLDSHLMVESRTATLTRPEIKQVARCILESLQMLHKDGLVHTNVMLDNILVNHGRGSLRFSEVQLGGFTTASFQDSTFAKKGYPVGAYDTGSPEVRLGLPWGTPTDVWSFGNAILNLVHGNGYNYFDPRWEGIELGDQEFKYTILKRMYDLVGPFPQSMAEIVSPKVFGILQFYNEEGPPQRPLQQWRENSIPTADKEFIGRILKLDPRDRPTVEEILQDEWFTEESIDTREPGQAYWNRKERKRGEGGPGRKISISEVLGGLMMGILGD
ncbi:serine/threonine protein kinase [Nemania abortiva]|nr:serine/threonine protein kinase [Nemania abortiva]